MKSQATEWKKIFSDHMSDEKLISRRYKNSSKLNSKKANNPILKASKRLKHTLHQKGYTDGKLAPEICSTSLVFREMKI